MGLDPVVSTPMPMIWLGRKAGFGGGLGQRVANRFFQSEQVVGWIFAREMVVVFVEQDALETARIIDNGGSEFLTGGAIDDQGAHRIRAVVDTES